MPQLPAPILPVAEICDRLVDLQKQRRFAIKQQSRADRSAEAFLATQLGYHAGLEQEQRTRLMALAIKIRRSVEQAGPGFQPPELGARFPFIAALILQSRDNRVSFDIIRRRIEDEMRALARRLPVWPWVAEVKGISELGLAVIVGEARDLGNYDNPAKIWKRLGLAVIDGRRQGRPEADSAEEWIRHGYNRQRRAEIWAFCDDVMFRAQWRGESESETGETIPAHAIGPYGEVYGARKQWVLDRGWQPGHADKDARRFMTKRFLRELWKAWRRAARVVVEPRSTVPPAAEAAE